MSVLLYRKKGKAKSAMSIPHSAIRSFIESPGTGLVLTKYYFEMVGYNFVSVGKVK
jgi:hypothetical protein